MTELVQIAHIRSDFSEKFGIPRQSGLIDTKAEIIFEEGYRDRNEVRGLSEFSHIWLLWGFSKNEGRGWSPMVYPPRLGGKTHVGVFATRSPFRPNGIGLSSVRLLGVEYREIGPVLLISGADLLDGSPIYDIKPYVAYTDSHPDAVSGFADRVKEKALEVVFPEDLLRRLPREKREDAVKILEMDPRPASQNDPGKRYGAAFAGFDIRFHVTGNVLKVCEVVPYTGPGGLKTEPE